ncbi:MAG: ParB/RepB/Spo0J family partition protein [Thermoplasmatota archaeon]
MKIKISDIKIGDFTVRKDLDQEYLKELKESLKMDGQWNPIIVRPDKNNGGYQLISGHTRYQGAKELGWKEIDANVKDLTDEEADILALKTNLMRRDMSEMEEGQVLKRYIDRYGLTYNSISKKLHKSPTWVASRINLIINVSKYIQTLLGKGLLTSWQVAKIASILNEEEQNAFAKYLVDNKIPAGRQTEEALKRFKNKTIFTIGYEGKNIDDFISILKENKIQTVVDIRGSSDSKHKPEFNGSVLARTLNHADINYIHRPELGVHYQIAQPYKDGYIDIKCLENWYKWNIEKQNEIDLNKLSEEIKDLGKTVFLCMEKYPTPIRDQKQYCHRNILVEMIMKTNLFSERIDL